MGHESLAPVTVRAGRLVARRIRMKRGKVTEVDRQLEAILSRLRGQVQRMRPELREYRRAKKRSTSEGPELDTLTFGGACYAATQAKGTLAQLERVEGIIDLDGAHKALKAEFREFMSFFRDVANEFEVVSAREEPKQFLSMFYDQAADLADRSRAFLGKVIKTRADHEDALDEVDRLSSESHKLLNELNGWLDFPTAPLDRDQLTQAKSLAGHVDALDGRLSATAGNLERAHRAITDLGEEFELQSPPRPTDHRAAQGHEAKTRLLNALRREPLDWLTLFEDAGLRRLDTGPHD